MKNDHSFTVTAAVILAGVVLAFVNPTDGNSAVPAVDGISATSSTLPNVAGAVAASDATVAKHGKRAHRSKDGCPQISRVDPRA